MRQLDLGRYRTRLVDHLTSEVMRRAKTDAFYNSVIRDAAVDQAQYGALVGFVGQARRFASRTADLGKRLWSTRIEDLGEAEFAVAENPYAFYQQSKRLADATRTMLANLQPGRSPRDDLVLGVAGVMAALNLPAGLAGFLLIAELGATITKLRDLNAQQEAESRKRINADVEVHYDDIAKIVRQHADYASDFITKTWIPVLKTVALERVTKNRAELTDKWLNWDQQSDAVAGELLTKAVKLEELIKLHKSGHKLEIGGEKLTDDDIERMEKMATFYRDESTARLDPKASKKKREQLKEAIDGYDEVAEAIKDGSYSALDYSGAVYAEARQRLGIGEFPEGTTVYGAILGGVPASREPFLAATIVEWKWRESSERVAKEFLKLAGQLLLTATTITLGVLLGPVGFVRLLGWIDAGWNLREARKNKIEAEEVLAMAKLDPGGTIRGISVDDAEKALKGARRGFYLAVALVAAPVVLKVGGRIMSARQ